MPRYKIHWLDKKVETLIGDTIADAFTKAGYGGGAVRAVDFYEEVKEGIFPVTLSNNKMPCIQIENPTKSQRDFLRSAVMNNFMDSEEYKLHCEAGAFLQYDGAEYILIEFWRPTYQPFVDWLNANFKPE